MSDSDDSSTSSYNSAEGVQVRFLLHESEVENLEEKLQRIVYIQQTDVKYHRALADMRDQSILSLVVEPSFYGRHQATSVLAVATANETYIFDIKALGSIFPELRRILVAEQPRKVVHYGHRIVDHLFHQHGFRLGGICDCFTALCVARRECTPCTLPEAISLVFGLPPEELVCTELSSTMESLRNFSGRPLTNSQKNYLARITILQMKLHDRLIYDRICADVQRMSMDFSTNFSKMKLESSVGLEMGPSSRFGFDSIDPHYRIDSGGLEEL
ncbi:hypothetical protein KR018_001878, partial [Drosophila ironensis]